MLHKEGSTIIITTMTIIGIINAVNLLYFNKFVLAILLISLVVLVLVLQFFRNPKRVIEVLDNNLVYAPADGKVVVIEDTHEDEFFKDKRLQVSIFMSPLNVHVNRCPFGGRVDYYKYHAGKYLVAWHPKASTENERTTTVFNNGKTQVLVRQIAGAVAKRIVNYVNVGDKVEQGNDFGFIKFGSRVDLFFPIGTEIKVNIDQKVKGNKTIIAQL